jgi:hypothetical protein
MCRCTEAIKARDLAELKNACKAVRPLQPSLRLNLMLDVKADDIVYDSPVIQEAKALRDLMEREKAAVKRLKDAIKARGKPFPVSSFRQKCLQERSLEDLTAAIEASQEFGKYVLDTDAYKQASLLSELLMSQLSISLSGSRSRPCHLKSESRRKMQPAKP